jgi:hypothetical protein
VVSVRENLTELEGEVSRREPDPHRPEYETVVLKVSGTAPVEGKPDLVRASTGDEVPIAVRRGLLGNVTVGTRVRLRASRTSSGDIMAEPHPTPEQFRIL